MKLSLLLSALILAGIGWLGWQRHAGLDRAAAVHSRLVAEARALGIGTDDLSGKAPLPREGKERLDQGPERERQAREAAGRFIALIAEVEESMKNRQPRTPDERLRRMMEMSDELLHFDPAQLKIAAAALRASPEIGEEMKDAYCGFIIRVIGEREPEAALAFALESGELKAGDPSSNQTISEVLLKWAEQNPGAALEWVRLNQLKTPELLSKSTRAAMLPGIALQDPGLAFSSLEELKLSGDRSAIKMIATGAVTPEDRSAVIEAMRRYLATSPGDEASKVAVDGIFDIVARTTAAEGFDRASIWLESAKLSPEETRAFFNGFNTGLASEDCARWIGWIGSHFPAGEDGGAVGRIVGNWVVKDYQAAGDWLNAQPAGPVKTEAIKAYVLETAFSEPATAAQWALTLPTGEERTKLVAEIYEQWNMSDPDAAAAFARQQGLPEQ